MCGSRTAARDMGTTRTVPFAAAGDMSTAWTVSFVARPLEGAVGAMLRDNGTTSIAAGRRTESTWRSIDSDLAREDNQL